MSNLFEGLCGKIAPGLCRFSIHGNIAVKTSSGYRAYDPDKRTLTNCDHFAFDVGDDFFFVVPTNKVSPGDIILAGGKPKCVLKAEGETITAINYEDATVETLLPERYMFMGSTYLYGKIVSMFGKNGLKGKKGMSGMMKYMMLTSLMKGGREGAHNLMPLMMMGGKMDFMDDLFDEEDDNEKEA